MPKRRNVYMINLDYRNIPYEPLLNEYIKHKYKVASTHDKAVSVATRWCLDICECLFFPHNECDIRNDLKENNNHEFCVFSYNFDSPHFKITIEKLKLY